ncbi:MAG: recombinase family protein [Muricomes sp.]
MNKNSVDFSKNIQLPFDTFKDKNRERNIVFYGRVSTEHEAQLSALENQIQWYDDQARFHPNWVVCNKYIDEGITGTQAEKRPAFLKMLEDAGAGKFDLIVTREVCRFARNTVDTLVTTRKLKSIGIEVYFVEDNIWTMDNDGELRLTIMATLAQEESRKVSERVKAGQHISRTKGVVYGNGNILGYNRVDGKYIVNEEQAETVRMIFDMYLNEGIGTIKIANELCNRRRVAASGQVKWTSSNVSRVLGNPTYMGYAVYGKSFSNNYLEQKRINNHNRDTYMYVKAGFEPLVSEEDWYKCEKIRKRRRRELSLPMKKKTPFGEESITSPRKETKDKWNKKLHCSCGASFRKNRWHKNKNKDWSYGYQCYNQLNNGSAKKRREQGLDDTGYCDVRMVADWKLEVMCKKLMEQIWLNKNEAIQKACAILKECYQESRDKKAESELIQRKISKIKMKISNLIDLRTEGDITTEEYRNLRKHLDEEMCKYEEELLKQSTANNTRQEKGLAWDKINTTLKEVIDISAPQIYNDLIDKFIARVVPKENNHFAWFVNLSALETEEIDMVVEGRKNNPTIYIQKQANTDEGDKPSVHSNILFIADIANAIKGEKYSPVAMQHRQLSKQNRQESYYS